MKNTYEEIWKQLLEDIIKNGSIAEKDDAELLEKIGNHVFIPNPYYNSGFTELVSEKQFSEAIMIGAFDIEGYPLKGEALHDYVVSITDEDKIYLDDDKSFIYTYPCRLVNYHNSINQLKVMLYRLIEHHGSNRAISTTLIPEWDSTREDIPCLQSLQCLIRNDEVILSCFFRSNDLYGAWVSNMMFLTYIGLLLTTNLKEYYPNLVFKGIDYHSSSLHIYKTDFEQAKKVVGLP